MNSYPCVCPGHTKAIVELHYGTNSSDGSSIFLAASLDKLPMLRDSVSGDWLRTFSGHKGAVWTAKLGADSRLAATGSGDFTAKLWEVETAKELATLDHPHVVKSVAFSPDGSRLATGCQDKSMRIFDVSRTDAAPTRFEHPASVKRVLWLPDAATGSSATAASSSSSTSTSSSSSSSSAVLTACDDGLVRLWDSRTPSASAAREVRVGGAGTPSASSASAAALSGAVEAAVKDIELSPDGTTLTAAAGRTIAIYDAHTLTLKVSHTVGFLVEGASLHPRLGSGPGGRIVAGGSDVWVHVLDAGTGAEQACHRGHHGLIHCIRYAPNGETYTTGSDDATVRIWDK